MPTPSVCMFDLTLSYLCSTFRQLLFANSDSMPQQGVLLISIFCMASTALGKSDKTMDPRYHWGLTSGPLEKVQNYKCKNRLNVLKKRDQPY